MKSSSSAVAGDFGDARIWNLPVFNAPAASPPTARELDEAAALARDEGFAQGRREGYEQGLEEARALARTLEAVAGQMSRPLAAVSAETERLLAELCLQVGRGLALRELKNDPAALAALVREAVANLNPAPRELTVRLHPDDLGAVGTVLDPASLPNWKLEADAKLARGDCVVATETATVDARMNTRVAELASALLGES